MAEPPDDSRYDIMRSGAESVETERLDDGETADLRLARAVDAFRAADRAEVDVLAQLAGIARQQSYRRDGAVSLTGWIRRMLGVDVAEARRLNRSVQLLVRLPELLRALQLGSTSLRHVDVLERTVTAGRRGHMDRFADQLVGFASSLGIDDYQVICARWAELVDQELKPNEILGGQLSVTSTLFGEADVRGRLSADQASPVLAALDLLVKPDPKNAPVRQTRRQKVADAFADLSRRFLDGDGSTTSGSGADGAASGGEASYGGDHARKGSEASATSRRARMVTTVVVDLDTLLNQNLEIWQGTRKQQPVLDLIRRSNAAGAPLPDAVTELLRCDASIQRLVVDGKGRPLDVGRAVRIVTPAQREALVHRDGGCVFPTCDRPAPFCDAHHVIPWEQGGPTDLDNLVLLCRHHHRLVHGDTWTIERRPGSGTVAATRREGWRQTTYRRDDHGGVEVDSSWRAEAVGADPPR